MPSSIEWTQDTWNPITGCTRISPGCKHCYAEIMANRLSHMKNMPQYKDIITKGRWNGNINFVESALDKPKSNKKPTTYFVNSMSDLFHNSVDFEDLSSVWEVMEQTPRHTYQVLTKRASDMKDLVVELCDIYDVLENVWLGTSVENKDYTFRIDHLRETQAAVKFLSLEPLLGPLDNLNLKGIDWVIVGGESGPGARPMKKEWVIDIKDQCLASNVPFFFKQWGGVQKKRNGRELDGVTWDEMPRITQRGEVKNV